MTPRVVFSKLLQRGKQIVSQFKNAKKAEVKVAESKQQQITQLTRSSRFGERVNNLWARAIPKAHYKTWASELRKQAAWRSGNLPLLGFAGFIIAHSSEDEEGEIVDQICNTVKENQQHGTLLERIQALSLDQFEFGRQIGQGCNAAVYEARLKPVVDNEDGDVPLDVVPPAEQATQISPVESDDDDDVSDAESDVTVLDMSDDDLDEDERAPTEFTLSVIRVSPFTADEESDSDSDLIVLGMSDDEMDEEDRAPTEFADASLNEFTALSMTCSEILATVSGWSRDLGDDMNIDRSDVDVLDDVGEYESLNSSLVEDTKFDLAVKMMFNYGIESNAATILRHMDNEAVPSRLAEQQQQVEPWENGHKVRKKRVPPHPNIVDMLGVFADPVPRFPEGLDNYPAALPSRLNPKGIGRNMTMFLVMKKYDCNLSEYLATTSLGFRERLLLLSQLLEAVVHLKKSGVAHRDMKSDNVLLDLSQGENPSLVLSDFGCCLADTANGLKLPYPTDEIDRGGNTALMPPEIACAIPGRNAVLDYSRADLWGAGALAYEVLGADNPFYSTSTRHRLDSRTYMEAELPPLPDTVPASVKKLVYSLLCRDPRKRPSPSVAANVLQVLLWAPSDWLLLSNCASSQNTPSVNGYKVKRSEVTWWLAAMAAEVILYASCHGNVSSVINLKKSFLERLNLNELFAALGFLGIAMDTSD